MPPNRIVLLATPIVAPAAGWLATQIAKYAPGLDISEGQLNEIFLAGIGVVVAAAAQFIHGYQKHEAREAEAARAADASSDAELEVSVDERSVMAPELEQALEEGDEDVLDVEETLDGEVDEDLDLEPVGAGAGENGQ